MFAGDYDRKGVIKAHSFSIAVHVLLLLLILWYGRQESKRLSDYVLTEVNMIQEVPDLKKPAEIEKPKKMFDILKQIIPVKPETKLASMAPQSLKVLKPEMNLTKPMQLSMEKSAQALKTGISPIDLDAEIGRHKAGTAVQTERISPFKQKQMVQTASAAVDLSGKRAYSGVQHEIIKTDISHGKTVLSAAIIKQPTPVIKETKAGEKAVDIPGKQAVLIQGEVAGRKILSSKAPQYPRWAQEQGIEASVTLHFYVTPEGVVKKNVIVDRTSGYPELDALAQEALLVYMFESLQTAGDQSGYAVFRFVLEK